MYILNEGVRIFNFFALDELRNYLTDVHFFKMYSADAPTIGQYT